MDNINSNKTNNSKNNNNYLNIFNQNENNNNFISDEELSYKFPYKLDPFQQEGIYRINKNENILITAHTVSGKTVLAIYAIAHCLKNNKKVIYTSPTKSLSNQKYAEFIDKFPSVGIMTGDIKMNPDAQCIIMTTEILRNILYKGSSEFINITDVGAVILDEVHYINDPDRGKVWEEVIILLPREITLVMLSASIDKPEVFASWIGNIKEKNISLIPTSHRVVPLKHYFWKSYNVDDNGKDVTKWELLEILDDKGKFKNYDVVQKNYKAYDINKIMDNLADFLVDQNFIPALFFKFSRKKCESICKTVRKNLLTFEEVTEVENLFHYYMKDYKKTYEILPQYQDVYCQLKKGVVYHHSGLIPILKEIIEILYSKGLVKILFATETFAIGVNMPTKTVLYSDLEKYDNKGLRQLRTDEYLQMSGRAGRRGLDKFGSVIILPTMSLPSENSLRNMMCGKSPMLNSKFKLSYQFVLKNLMSNNLDVFNFLSKTLISDENDKMSIAHNIEKENVEKKLEELGFNPNTENIIFKKYETLKAKLDDTFFVVKKKDRLKLVAELDNIQKNPDFAINYEKYKIYKDYSKELQNIEENIWNTDYFLKNNINIIEQILEKEGYIHEKNITTKGIIASCINECNELLMTEMIFGGLLDDIDFPEIVAVLSAFINEKDQNGEQRFINDLNVPKKVANVLKELQKMAEKFMDIENENKLYIGTDYDLYLDFIEPSYIWASGGSIHDVYANTSIYDGNFVKAILRINNICENLMDICKTIEKNELCVKLEEYNKILIRDITTINSLYVK